MALPETLDPEIARFLTTMPELVFSAETLPALRVAFQPGAEPDIERRELTAGPGGEVELTLLRPRGAVGDLPTLYWIHGGGFVIGDRYMDDAHLAHWCRAFSCACVSVEYRLAPEAPYPAPLDDCDTGLRHVLDHAGELGIDADRLGIGGRSAGGALAAALTLRLRDRGDRLPTFLYLEYPMLDDRRRTPSSQLDGLPIWSRESNAFAWRSYLADRCGSDDLPAEAAPSRTRDLAGLPPAFVCVGTVDVLRDEAIDFAARLNRAGVPTELHVYAGAIHGYHLFADSAVVRCAIRDSADWLRRRFAPTTAPGGP